MANSIELKSISDLLGMKFFIPSYQRGYRWSEQQVSDLLNDIWDFTQNTSSKSDFYCLQPLVVKRKDEDILTQIKSADTIEEVQTLLKGSWEVIDGQQRLTTILLILAATTKGNLYSIQYETRKSFDEFLMELKATSHNTDSFEDYVKAIDNSEGKNNIDFYHIWSAYKIIANNNFISNKVFLETLLSRVKFIWYESVNEDPIKVFTRLNVGKISLTNAELIKALFLNRSNFETENSDYLRLRQIEIANEWDHIEYTLQNDEFWLFLHTSKYDKPTRIDFIFELLSEQNVLKLSGEYGTDKYKTFRYFYDYYKQDKNKFIDCWNIVKEYFQIFQEWYSDLVLYHYIGFVVEYNYSISELIKVWKEKGTKSEFIKELKTIIKRLINNCNDLNKQYEIGGSPKTQCRPLLLLHNIQTIINQNRQLESKEEYKLAIFHKFPFHLFKKEKWDVEHIDSNTTNELEKETDQKEWLKYASLDGNLSEDIKEKIKSFLNDTDGKPSFEDLVNDIEELNKGRVWSDEESDKNKIWNFVLLDANTNRGYGNAIFPAKRRCIIGKDQGLTYSVSDDLKVSSIEGKIAFIPPVTKNVFLKYYNTSDATFKNWNKSDAEAYKANILETLKEFGVVDSSNNQNV